MNGHVRSRARAAARGEPLPRAPVWMVRDVISPSWTVTMVQTTMQ